MKQLVSLLRELKMCIKDEQEEQICAEVLESEMLHTVFVYCCATASSPILRALKRNRTVKNLVLRNTENAAIGIKIEKEVLSILLNDNTTLEEFNNTDSSKWGKTRRINYLTTLNRCGRGQLRQSATTSDKLVDMLMYTPADEKLSLLTSNMDMDHEQAVMNVRYGLLLESPALWCKKPEKVNSRKRKQASQN